MTTDKNLILRLAALQTHLSVLQAEHEAISHLLDLISCENPGSIAPLRRATMNDARAKEGQVLKTITSAINALVDEPGLIDSVTGRPPEPLPSADARSQQVLERRCTALEKRLTSVEEDIRHVLSGRGDHPLEARVVALEKRNFESADQRLGLIEHGIDALRDRINVVDRTAATAITRIERLSTFSTAFDHWVARVRGTEKSLDVLTKRLDDLDQSVDSWFEIAGTRIRNIEKNIEKKIDELDRRGGA